MTVGIVDTTVIVHYFRKNPNAQAWVNTQPAQLSVVSITSLEVMHGAGSKVKEAACKSILEIERSLFEQYPRGMEVPHLPFR